MITKTDSLITAEHIVNCVLNDSEIQAKVSAYVESYQNGREQGLLIWGPSVGKGTIGFYICEGRRSDSIYIYKGPYAMQGTSEEAYSHVHTFGRDFDKAVEWLKDELKTTFPNPE
jgi:hypothetical protein